MRRERDRVLGEILRTLAQGGPSRATRSRLARHVHVPYGRLQEYVGELVGHALLTPDDPPRLTDRGWRFLQGYEQYLERLAEAGLDGDGWSVRHDDTDLR